MASGWPALPDSFDVAFLHSGRTIHHLLEGARLTWFDREAPADRHTHSHVSVELAPGLWLLEFSKEVEARMRRTFLVVDGNTGQVFDATFLEEGPSHWRFDRGTAGRVLAVDAAFSFPRRDVDGLAEGSRPRAFELPGGLILVAAEDDGAPLLAVWAHADSAPERVYTAPAGR